ncbi:Imidazole glycerol phosphate synthase subunit HisH [Planktothrix tepida]|uniref:Imidazole glycerol phosphate synthase subunit HisH n=2 Tax=Planktothrix TaxID=54304 RepID=A0A1J1LLG9_9CYAN|nr:MULTISPECIES: addiction module protein [Planktothrix]CAD5948758.1 Imidazole glycerol phosphate synthase subunit HisH [Planktothrix tepida]CAD5961984.1 Imidazole glycerol phosphate synthase subunit HisH [Planktothrix pseudagardhii]CUR32457.1 Imidazole glycerol phosphate synthase subunit HisH [Planktothrix tepida PCC 9214]
MDLTATLNQITSLSIVDRIRLVQAIWDSIAEEQTYLDLTDVEKQELDHRITAYETNPDDVMTWEDIKASIKRK